MCGFAGECVFDGTASTEITDRMARRILHRGPDEQQHRCSPDGRVAISFNRLAIIDPQGSSQPMTTADGSAMLACNGEIYNYQALRKQTAYPYVTKGDTEVALAVLTRHGSEGVAELDGMFAMAYYNLASGELLLARDRVGQKPLWIATLEDRIVFASELKAILEHPGVSKDVDPESILYYLTMGTIPGPRSIYKSVQKLPPASVLHVRDGRVRQEVYWSPPTGAGQNPSTQEQIKEQLRRSVSGHMLSDVPMGALLSGGLDSAVIVATMCELTGDPSQVRTFSAGFEDRDYDERRDARRVAAHLGTQHTELEVVAEKEDMAGVIVGMHDEPFADSSAIPMSWICRAAREHVTVCLTGDGGDEIFGGYDRYRALQLADALPLHKYMLLRFAAWMARPFASGTDRSRIHRLVRFSDALIDPAPIQYFRWRSLFDPADLGRLVCEEFVADMNPEGPMEWFTALYEESEFETEAGRAQRHDLLTYLPDDVLRKTDIASMASSLELRAPFLDHKLVEMGLSLPIDRRMDAKRGKLSIRELFRGVLPESTLQGRKRGFGVPLCGWLRGSMREEMVDTLTKRSFLDQNIINPAAIAGLMNDHLSGKRDQSHRLWSLMVLARWLSQ